MTKKTIGQYVYNLDRGDGQRISTAKNGTEYTSDLNEAIDITKNIFEGKIITQLGIQAPNGIEFYINGGESPVIMGTSRIFELSDPEIIINKLRFESSENNKDIIIDYIQREEV